jgi:hypothetical protein
VTCEQIFAPGSQVPVQHSPSAAQVSPTNLHEGPLPPVPLPALPPVAPPVPGEPDAPPDDPPPPPEPGPVMASVLDEPQPMAQSPEPNRAIAAPTTSFFTPTSTEVGSFGNRPLVSGGVGCKRLTFGKPERDSTHALVGACP